MTLAETLKLAPVVPVLIIDDVAQAVPLAKALVAGGLYALEVTLRTPVALDCIRRIAGEVEGAVGDVRAVVDAVKADLCRGLIGAAHGGAQVGAQRGDGEHAAAGGDGLAVLQRGPGVEDDGVGHGTGRVEP